MTFGLRRDKSCKAAEDTIVVDEYNCSKQINQTQSRHHTKCDTGTDTRQVSGLAAAEAVPGGPELAA